MLPGQVVCACLDWAPAPLLRPLPTWIKGCWRASTHLVLALVHPLHPPLRRKTWPLLQAMDAAAQALVAGVPEAQPDAARLHELATHFAPGPDSQTLRPDPRNLAPPELLGLLVMQERACCNPRCKSWASAPATTRRSRKGTSRCPLT